MHQHVVYSHVPVQNKTVQNNRDLVRSGHTVAEWGRVGIGYPRRSSVVYGIGDRVIYVLVCKQSDARALF